MDADGTDPAEGSAAAEAETDSTHLTVQSYIPQDPGPYPQDKPPENTVRFTPVQVRLLTMRNESLFEGDKFAHNFSRQMTTEPCSAPACHGDVL